MSTDWQRAATLCSAIGAGISGGVFFGFSSFVMKALDRLPNSQAVAAMQAINKAAPTPLFMTALFGTAVTSVAAGVGALGRLDEPGTRLTVLGAGLFVGCIVITAAYHVPRNDALAAIDASTALPTAWSTFSSGWTAMNHVRTVAATTAAIAMTVAYRRLP